MSHFGHEIREQPEVLRAVLDDPAIAQVAERLRARPLRLALTLARGSSDNAVTFFVYLCGRYLGLPVASLPPSLFTVYGSKMRLEDALAVGVSQSGESSDVVEGLKALSAAGAVTLAISNQEGSSLSRAADEALAQHAGLEQAVAASKTFSSQMMVLACLVARLCGDAELLAALEAVPEAVRGLLSAPGALEPVALRLTHAEGLYVLGRGFSFGPAHEVALKLKETSYLHAQAYSSAEFQHGPIAAVGSSEPVLLLGLGDASLASNRAVAERLRELGADLTVLSGAPELLELATSKIALPAGLHPVTEAFLQVVAGQLLALELTRSKGLDPDQPRHLQKVTKTL